MLSSFATITSIGVAGLLMTLRLGPAFASAPPFSLIRIPVRVRVALIVGLAFTFSLPFAKEVPLEPSALLQAAAAELLLGTVIAFAWQGAFAGLLFAGRVLDLQAGFGIAQVIDPSTRAQMPLFGALIAMVAGLIFFASGAHRDMLRLIALLNQFIPLGAFHFQGGVQPLIKYLGSVAVIGLAVVSVAFVVLFMIDLLLAFLSRTLPQMNVLVLGLQVKTIVSILVLASSCRLLEPVMARLAHLALRLPAELTGTTQ